VNYSDFRAYIAATGSDSPAIRPKPCRLGWCPTLVTASCHTRRRR